VDLLLPPWDSGWKSVRHKPYDAGALTALTVWQEIEVKLERAFTTDFKPKPLIYYFNSRFMIRYDSDINFYSIKFEEFPEVYYTFIFFTIYGYFFRFRVSV